MMTNPIKKVAIVGGTHGNEFTGVYLIKKFQKFPELLNQYNFEKELVIANPEAFAVNKRYIDRDLNRCFKKIDLVNNELQGYENQRAKQLNQQLGPKGHSKVDFIIDCHTSTAPMGINLVLTQSDPFHLKLVDYVQKRIEDVTITWESLPDHHFLMSMAEKHMLIEVGATSQGQLRHDVFDKTEATCMLILDFIEHYNNQTLPQPSETVEVYQYFDVAYLPQDEHGNITGMVHQDIQDKDFTALKSGQAIFKLFNGQEVIYQGEDCFMSFINEAAYYDEKKAFAMSKKMYLPISTE